MREGTDVTGAASPSPIEAPRASLIRRLPRGAVAGAAALVAVALAWGVPPALDWSRMAPRIAGFASTRLGLHVSIDGPVALRLLPRPVLVAQNVSLFDRDAQAHVGALRLELSLPALLRLELQPTDLVLVRAALVLPWRVGAAPPRLLVALPAGFAARVEDASIHLGALHLNELTGTLAAGARAGALTANGTVKAQGMLFRFDLRREAVSSARGAEVVLSAQSAGAKDTAFVSGVLTPDGGFEGKLHLEAPRLLRTQDGSALPLTFAGTLRWSAEAAKLTEAVLTLGEDRLTGSARSAGGRNGVAVQLTADRLRGDRWTGLLGSVSAWQPAGKVHVAAAVGEMTLGGWTLNHVSAAGVWAEDSVRVDSMSAELPGDTRVSLTDGRIGGSGGEATISLASRDGAAVAAAVPADLPAADAVRALTAALAPPGQGFRARARLAVDSGQWQARDILIDTPAHTISGSATIRSAPGLRAVAELDASRFDLGLAAPHLRDAVAILSGLPAGGTVDVRFGAASPRLLDGRFRDLAVDLNAGPEGVSLRRAAIGFGGATVTASGALSPDLGVPQARLDLTAPDAAGAMAALPTIWRRAPLLFQGAAHATLSAAGPAGRIGVTFRGDVNDLRAEAEGVADLGARRVEGTATLRHPGAPRLLAGLGLPDADAWLDHGSVAVTAHVQAGVGRVSAADISISAALLRASGSLDLDLTQSPPGVSGLWHAETLPLPAQPAAEAALPWALLVGYSAALGVQADHVSVARRPAATAARATITVSGGSAFVDAVEATLPIGRLVGGVAASVVGEEPRLVARGALLGAGASLLPGRTLTDGRLDLAAEVSATGLSPAAWLASAAGEFDLVLSGARLQRVDMQRLGRALAARPRRVTRALTAAATIGAHSDVSGTVSGQVEHGVAHLVGATVQGEGGTLRMDGTVDVAARTLALHLQARPDGAASALPISLIGPWDAARWLPDFRAVLSRAAPPVKVPTADRQPRTGQPPRPPRH